MSSLRTADYSGIASRLMFKSGETGGLVLQRISLDDIHLGQEIYEMF